MPGAAVTCLLAYLAVLVTRGRPSTCPWLATNHRLLSRGAGHLAGTWGRVSTCWIARGRIFMY